jgi:succinate dehydrogenase / fumarate reductase cytochrome b subunit
MTMMMSIVHRLTGTSLYFGTLLLTWWLIAAAEGQTSRLS